jgi:hypothetical protein
MYVSFVSVLSVFFFGGGGGGKNTDSQYAGQVFK